MRVVRIAVPVVLFLGGGLVSWLDIQRAQSRLWVSSMPDEMKFLLFGRLEVIQVSVAIAAIALALIGARMAARARPDD
jgi:hypothetical protein